MTIEEINLEVEKPAVHFTLQGKGGVGKSFVSYLTAQYFMDRGDPVYCYDTDPVNHTLQRFTGLGVRQVDLMDANSLVIPRKFDSLIDSVIENDGHSVVDNGASSFLPISSYIINNDVIGMIEEAGHEVFIHCVIKGGQDLQDTMAGFNMLAQQESVKRIVVWLNERFGPIELDGREFEEFKPYLEHSDKVAGIIRLKKRDESTFETDVNIMVSNNLTFQQAIANTELFGRMPRRRLAMIRDDVFQQLDGIF